MQIEKEYSVNFCFACCFQTILNDVRIQYCFSSVIIIIYFFIIFHWSYRQLRIANQKVRDYGANVRALELSLKEAENRAVGM